MRREDAKVGMKVRISMGDCKETDQFCGFHNEMKKLRGSITSIRSINFDGGVSTATGWAWHPADLMPISESISKEKRKKVKPVLFDEELLWTE